MEPRTWGRFHLKQERLLLLLGKGQGRGIIVSQVDTGNALVGPSLPKMRFSAREGWTIIRACHAGPKEEEID